MCGASAPPPLRPFCCASAGRHCPPLTTHYSLHTPFPPVLPSAAAFENVVQALYKYVVPKPKAECSKGEQLTVSFAAGYIAGILCAVVSHPADNLVSKLNATKVSWCPTASSPLLASCHQGQAASPGRPPPPPSPGPSLPNMPPGSWAPCSNVVVPPLPPHPPSRPCRVCLPARSSRRWAGWLSSLAACPSVSS